MSTMNQILDNLWLGDMVGASNKFLLKKNGITHILTVAQGLPPKYPTQFEYKVVNILDCPSANLKQHFPSCVKFIREAIAKGGTVYVHCFAGVSRSTSTVCAYLIQEYGMTFSQALQHCKSKRYFVNPNDGFRRQLIQWSREVKSKAPKAPSDSTTSALPPQIKQNEDEKVETKVTSPHKDLILNGGSIISTSPEIKYQTSNLFNYNSQIIQNRSTLPTQNKFVSYGSPSPPKSKNLISQNKSVGMTSKVQSVYPSTQSTFGSPYRQAPMIQGFKSTKSAMRKNF